MSSSLWHRVAPSPITGDDTGFDLLGPSSSTTSLPCLKFARKDQPILAPSQRAVENAEVLLIVGLGSDHLITGLPFFLECRFHFRKNLTRTSDKHVIAMHRPRDGAQLIVEAATRHSANGETATDEPFSQLLSPRCCSWASSVQRLAQLPNMRCPEFGKYIIGQLDKGVSLLFSVEIRSPSVKHGYDSVLTLDPPSCVCDHSFD